MKKGYGKYGWILIVLLFFVCLCSTLMVAALGVVTDRFHELYGLDSAYLLKLVAIAGLVAAVSCIFFSMIISRTSKCRGITIFSLILIIFGLATWGFASSYLLFFVCYTSMLIGVVGAGTYGAPMLIGNWFPRKKGVVIGIVTVGMNIGTMLTAVVLTALWKYVSFKCSFMFLSVVALIPLILLILFIKEKPEMQGCYPDNDSSNEFNKKIKGNEYADLVKKTSPFTLKKLLKLKQIWLIIIANGLLQMVAFGVTANVTAASVSFGNSMEYALGLSVATSIIAIPGSIVLGFVDSKVGTKKACVISALVGTIAMVILLFHGTIYVAIAGVITFGFLLGTSNNLVNSLMVSIFGRHDFPQAIAVVMPFLAGIRLLGVLVVSISLSMTGGYDLAIKVFVVLAAISTISFLLLSDKCIGRTDEEIEKIIENAKKK